MLYNKGTTNEREEKNMVKVIFKDMEVCKDYYFNLTDDQYRLLLWLYNQDFLVSAEIEVFKDYDFEEL